MQPSFIALNCIYLKMHSWNNIFMFKTKESNFTCKLNLNFSVCVVHVG